MASTRPEPRSDDWFARDAEINELVARQRLVEDWQRPPEERLEMVLRLSAVLIELSQASRRDERQRA
jgi:hypothetical protein